MRLLKASFKNNKNENIDLESLPLIPIKFETNKGSLNQSNYMISGIGTAILTGSFNTSSNVKLSVSNQVINLPISFNKFNNPVINSRNSKSYKSIQEAINDANTLDGDVLKLKAGVYLENVCIFKKVSLTSFGDGEALIFPKNDSTSSTIIVSEDNVSIKNLSIYGTVSTNALFSTGNSFVLSNCKVFNSFAGIYLYDASGASLNNNSISGCSYGLYLDGSDNGSFTNNAFFNNDYGILNKYSNANVFKSNVLFNNWMAIEDSSKYNGFVTNNIHDNYQGIRLIASSSALLDNTNVYNNYLGILKYSSSFTNKSSSVYNNSLINVQSLNDGEIVIQDNMWYCGAAALSIIFEKLGLTVSQKDIAGIAGTNANGTSLYGLYQACIHYGFNSTVWKLPSSSNLRVNDLVVLLFEGEYHFSVVYGINESHIVLNDPSIGLFELDKETFNELFSGYVLDAEPINDRGVKVSLAQMKSVVGTFAFLFPPAYYVATVVVIGVGALALSWQNNHHYKSPKKSIPKPHNHWRPFNKIHFPRYVKYPNSGRNGYKPKYNYHPVTSYLSGNKHYANHKASLYKYNVKKGSVNSYNVAEIAYQEAYNYYLSTKNKERAKIIDKNDLDSYKLFIKDYNAFNKNEYKFLPGPIGPDNDLPNTAKLVKALSKDANKNFNQGKILLKNGQKSKGVYHISVAMFEISLIPSLIFNELNLKI